MFFSLFPVPDKQSIIRTNIVNAIYPLRLESGVRLSKIFYTGTSLYSMMCTIPVNITGYIHLQLLTTQVPISLHIQCRRDKNDIWQSYF